MDEHAQGELKKRLLELGWPEQEVDAVLAKQSQEEERLSLGLCPVCGELECYRRCVRSTRP